MQADGLDDPGGISAIMVEMTRRVGTAVHTATEALLTADLGLAQAVIGGDAAIDEMQARVEDISLELLAGRVSDAGRLRTVVTGLRMAADVERMGDLARHVAKLARLRYPTSPIPAELHGTVREMGDLAERIVGRAGSVIATRDLAGAAALEADDDVMDGLHRQLFRMLLSPQWTHGVEAAVDVTLCGRYYERFADHAVTVARDVRYLVTGDRPDTGRPVGPVS